MALILGNERAFGDAMVDTLFSPALCFSVVVDRCVRTGAESNGLLFSSWIDGEMHGEIHGKKTNVQTRSKDVEVFSQCISKVVEGERSHFCRRILRGWQCFTPALGIKGTEIGALQVHLHCHYVDRRQI